MADAGLFILTGGPGAGKTAVLECLHERGYLTIPESARQVIVERKAQGLSPRPDPEAFAREILSRDIEQYQRATGSSVSVFFDRGIPDAMAMLELADSLHQDEKECLLASYPYDPVVYLFPPWPEIYQNDAERDQDVEQAQQVHDDLRAWYLAAGYTLVNMPRSSIVERADFIQRNCSENALVIGETANIEPLWDLLLLADPSREIVEAYVTTGQVFVARLDGRVAGVCVVVPLGESAWEIKNIAVDPGFQRRGIGAALLDYAKDRFLATAGVRLRICTGNTSIHQIALYQKAGFAQVDIDKGFFVRNYAEPIYENGARCEDLVIMEQTL